MPRLSASVSFEQAVNRTWDCIVIGAGPAGSLAAHTLARRGYSVLLTDKAEFPRRKVCGCCLNRRALALLAGAGLGHIAPRSRAVPLSRLELAAGGRHASLALPPGAACSRERFDAALIQSAAETGAAFLPGVRAALADAGDGMRRVLLQASNGAAAASARLVLAAGGLDVSWAHGHAAVRALPEPSGRIGMAATVDDPTAFYRPGAIYMSCGPAGYVGLVRVEDGRLNVAAAFEPAALQHGGGPAPLVAETIARAGWPIPNLASSWQGTPILRRRPAAVAAERTFLIGDAAGYIEPFTGEGIAWALESALAVAPIAERAIRGWHPRLSAVWSRMHGARITRRQRLCRFVAGVLRHRALVGALILLLGRMPRLASPALQWMNSGHVD